MNKIRLLNNEENEHEKENDNENEKFDTHTNEYNKVLTYLHSMKENLSEGIVFNWEKMKKNKGLLSEYNIFRKVFVDKLLAASIKEIGAKCQIQEVGSKNLKSDYDITLSGTKVPEVISLFHESFEKIFHDNSANVFDTNIYGKGFFEPYSTQTIKQLKNGCPYSVFPYSYDGRTRYVRYIYLDKKTDKNIIKDQHAWAIVKLLINMHGESEENKKLLTKLPMYERGVNKFLALPDLNKLSIEQRNELYVKQLKVVQTYEDKFCSENKENVKYEYQNSIALANYYALETYFTRGAFFHIVGLQSNIKLPISVDEYIDSYIENIGDTFKSISHLSHMLSIEGKSSQCKKVLIEISKYYFRAMEARSKITKVSQDLMQSLDKLRKLRGKDVCNDDYNCVTEEEVNNAYEDYLEEKDFYCDKDLMAFKKKLLLDLANVINRVLINEHLVHYIKTGEQTKFRI